MINEVNHNLEKMLEIEKRFHSQTLKEGNEKEAEKVVETIHKIEELIEKSYELKNRGRQ